MMQFLVSQYGNNIEVTNKMAIFEFEVFYDMAMKAEKDKIEALGFGDESHLAKS